MHYNYNGLGQLVEKNLHCPTCPGVAGEINEPGTVYADIIERDVYNTSETKLIAKTQIRLLPGYNTNGNPAHGRIGKSLADIEPLYTPSMFLQSVDYRHTIQGQVESINNAQLVVNTANNDDANDYFGMEFLYSGVESALGNSAYFNGNISAVKWKGPAVAAGAQDQRSYTFTYDKADRLMAATSRMMNNAGAWTKEANVFNESMTYDHNGNMETLQRNDRKYQFSGGVVSYVSEMVDNLTYTYSSTMGDQLLKVEDAVAGIAGAAGFSNGGSGSGNDYTYNANGDITTDQNKGISSVVYNHMGKAQQVNFTSGKRIEYIYDAAGSKLTMKDFDGSTLLKTTDYVNGFVYENGALAFFSSPEGRVVKNGSTLEYQYAIADNQGNTRVVFSSATPAPAEISTNFESAANSDFQNYSRTNFNAMDHTDAGTTYTYSQLLNGGYNSQAGVAKSFKVYPGDKVSIEAFANFLPTEGAPTNPAALATSIAGAFGLSAASVGKDAEAYQAINAMFSGGPFITSSMWESNTAPKAYLNYILFDENFNLYDFGFDQVGAECFNPAYGHDPDEPCEHERLYLESQIKQPGYIYIYLSNENPAAVDVYFDDLKITHTKTNIIQYNEYYPFGLQASTSWTRENNSNNFLYNEGSELNQTSGWYETMFRNYDPAIGRFTGIDPLATQYGSISGYHYAGNNPVMMNDPTGAYWDGYTEREEINAASGGPDNSWWWSDGPTGEGYGTPYGAGPGNSNTGYAHSNAPDAWNVMNNFSNGVPNSIATGISSSVPVNAWQSAMIYNPWGGEDLGGNRYGGKWIMLNSTEGRALFKNQYGKNSGVVIQTQGGSGNKITMPAFATLWANYPPDVVNPDGSISHGHPSSDSYAINQCSIRVGYALIQSGVDFSNYPESNKTSEGYPRSAQNLADWLWTNYKPPVIVDQVKFEEKYQNSTGIMYQVGRHIDLWNKGATGSGYYWADKVWFWEIK